MIPDSVKELATEISPYINELTDKYSEIESVWLFGSRANASYSEESDWDLFIFANGRVLDSLKTDTELRRENIDLLVVFNGNDFKAPWQKSGEKHLPLKYGSLTGWGQWGWEKISDVEAVYIEAKNIKGHSYPMTRRIKAWRIWP